MDKRSILQSVSFGDRVAENETEGLKTYFVETDQWRGAILGNVDVFYGPKGAGKSAIYLLLHEHTNTLFDRQILFIAAENPRGNTAFQDILTDPPTSEVSFVALWKLYFVSLVADTCREYGLSNPKIDAVVDRLTQAGLLEDLRAPLVRHFSDAVGYVRRFFHADSIEAGPDFDSNTGMVTGFRCKITLASPSIEARADGAESLDTTINELSEGLALLHYKVWLGIDRLDVAFADNPELEANALRALFRVYLDLQSAKQICLKVFLRSDIWRRIIKSGFREASHITRTLTIDWTSTSLLNLVMRRLLQSTTLCDAFSVNREAVLGNFESQVELFYRVFPPQIDIGERRPTTLDWMLTRTADGSSTHVPRELIHLLDEAKKEQLRRSEIGEPFPEGEFLFSRSAIKDSLIPVSSARLQQTLYAEYPSIKQRVELLREEKATQTSESLAGLWSLDPEAAKSCAEELVEVGFFERRGVRGADPEYRVPFLYRSALASIQGRAD